MDKQETLGLENLGLEEPAAPRNASRTKKRKDESAKDEAVLQIELQKASWQHTPSINLGDLPMLASYQPLPIAPFGRSADVLNHWPWRDHRNRFIQTSPDVPRYYPVQFVSPLDPPNVTKYHQHFDKTPTLPRVTAAPFVQPRLSSRGSKPIGQKSSLSVLKYYGLASSRVDKQYRYLKDNLQLTGSRTGSPPTDLGKSSPQSSRSPHSTKIRDLEITPPAPRKPSPSTADGKDELIYLPAPFPTSAYLNDANAIPNILPSPQRLLIVLDLNGTLLYRLRASQNYTSRPGLPKFLRYAFKNHSLFVWSSAQPHNVKGVCSRLFSRDQREMLLGEWGRNTLGLTTAQYKKRVTVYKCLDRIWDNENLQHLHPDFERGERWGQHNTVLIDDSALKASAQPFNHVEVPAFMRNRGEIEGDGRDVLGQVAGYLEEARKWSNLSSFVRQRPFKMDWAAEKNQQERNE